MAKVVATVEAKEVAEAGLVAEEVDEAEDEAEEDSAKVEDSEAAEDTAANTTCSTSTKLLLGRRIPRIGSKTGLRMSPCRCCTSNTTPTALAEAEVESTAAREEAEVEEAKERQ